MPGYSLTICNAQGQTLSKALIWFDVDYVPMAPGYVAISRLKNLNDMLLLTPLKVTHFRPNTVQDCSE